jgi:hypothetical protein
MKKQITLLQWLIVAMGIAASVNAQPAYTMKLYYDTLSENNVSALFTSDGTLNFKPPGFPAYRVPKTGSACSIFCGSLWIGGIDAGKQLHTAAETYYQNGTDFWPGPIMDSSNYSTHQDTIWDKIYTMYKSTVDSFKSGLFGKNIPRSILDWPGDGDVSLGEMQHLAPYADISKSGYYNPGKGDYPLIRGDEAAYMIYNDARGAKHTETGGMKFGIEVHLMAYQFKNVDTAINEATFLHYDIYNRSQTIYDSVYAGNWVDMDIGNGGDDYIGCDSSNNYWYCYNGEAVDPGGSGQFAGEIGYLSIPPAQAVVYLCDTMKYFMYYNNDFTVQGNPTKSSAYYDYLKGHWQNNFPMTYGGNGYDSTGTPTNYMFSGNPATGQGWSEVSVKDPYGDRRGISSVGPFTLTPGTCKSVDVALVFAQNMHPGPTANLQSVTLLNGYVTDVKNFYNSQSYGCDTGLLAVNEVKPNMVSAVVYPNPSNGKFNVQLSETSSQLSVEVYNVLGEKVLSQLSTVNYPLSIDLSSQPTGIYLYRVTNKDGAPIASGKLVISR